MPGGEPRIFRFFVQFICFKQRIRPLGYCAHDVRNQLLTFRQIWVQDECVDEIFVLFFSTTKITALEKDENQRLERKEFFWRQRSQKTEFEASLLKTPKRNNFTKKAPELSRLSLFHSLTRAHTHTHLHPPTRAEAIPWPVSYACSLSPTRMCILSLTLLATLSISHNHLSLYTYTQSLAFKLTLYCA